jgi:hypothetical protein
MTNANLLPRIIVPLSKKRGVNHSLRKERHNEEET